MEKILVLHGGPGLDSSYIKPIFERNLEQYDILAPDFNDKASIKLTYQLSKISNYFNESSITICHSFGSLLFLKFLDNFKPKLSSNYKIVFSNWIYDYNWLDLFDKKNPKVIANAPTSCLKDQMLYYSSLYFETEKLNVGKKILNKINYSDDVNNSIYNQIKDFDSLATLFKYSEYITSLHCDNERIISPTYINDVCKKYNISNTFLDSSSHFPFIDNEDIYFKTLKELIWKISLNTYQYF